MNERGPGVIRIEMLPAGAGDCLLVSYGPPGDTHHILIDGGTAGTFLRLSRRLDALAEPIDLLVVTHVDADHVGGAVKLLEDRRRAASICTVWFNGYVHLEAFSDLLGPVQGERLTAAIVGLGLPWNNGWPGSPHQGVGGPVVVTTDPPVVPLPGGATARVLSPTPAGLAALLPDWIRLVDAAGLRPRKAPTAETELVAPGLLGASLTDLFGVPTPVDASVANGSCIAFILEYKGVRVLFGADAHPGPLVTGLQRLAGGGRYRIDACKVPHHGSRYNVTRQLVELLDCSAWLISTNGKRFQHPDDIALARIVVGAAPGRPARLTWNYRGDRYLSWTETYPPEVSGYAVEGPPAASPGITVAVP